jgi:hypothetical protein
MRQLCGLRHSAKRIVVSHGIRPASGLDRGLKCRPCVGSRVLGEAGIELGQRSGVAKQHHCWGNFIQTVVDRHDHCLKMCP